MGEYILNLVSGLSNIVDHTNDLVSLGSIDVGQEPVVEDISLDSPGQLEVLVLVDKVNELGLWLADGSLGVGESVVVSALTNRLGLFSFDRKRQHFNGILEGVYGILLVTLGERAGQLALVEAVSV
jgi:hypothetical protein